MNEKFQDVSVEDLTASSTEKQAALAALIEAAGDKPTPAQVTEGKSLAAEIDDIEAALAEHVQANADFADLKGRKFGVGVEADEQIEASDETEEEVEASDETEDDEVETEVEAPPAEAAVKPETASPKRVAQFAKKGNRPAPPENPTPGMSIVAAANVDGYSTGQRLTSLDDIAQAAVAKMKGFTPPSGDGTSEDLQKFGVASIRLDFDDEFVIDRHTDDMSVLYRAADEKRLKSDQGEGSLVAAGGWCSPSETMYDLAADESLEGIISLPEVQVKRGGIRYTTGPQFADFYAEAGFIQTEAQAIAGTTKPCYEVDCPSFTDVRLDAVGVCIKVPILTNAAYPELVNRFTSGTLIAHEHMVNLSVINRMVTFAGAARVFADEGSSVSDAMEALELVADQRRQTYRLPLGRTMEAVVPFWVRAVYRNDLARRTGANVDAITDAQVAAHFSARKINVQYAYDWQPISLTAEVYPTTYQVLVYPAGTFVKGVSDVINLSAVYDAASLAVNTYTGLFVEQGLLVAKMQYDADLLTLPVCSMGRTGAANLTCS